jgi:DNA invertase Pin-like site-specific DNA recombinase
MAQEDGVSIVALARGQTCTTGAVAYYRVSTEFQRGAGYSLEAQRALVRWYVQDTDLTLIGECEEAESGYRAAKVTLDKRPALRTELALCRRRKASLVIAALAHRLYRDPRRDADSFCCVGSPRRDALRDPHLRCDG